MAAVSTIEDACQLLRLILQLYRETGPESIESLTRSYLSSPPTSDSAKDVVEGTMADAFNVFDDATDSVLSAFAAGLGFDLLDSATYRRRRDEGYFRTLYPVLVTYMIWLDQEGEEKVLENLQYIFCSTIFGVAGYVILDSNLDEEKENPTEVLISLSFIQEHERLLLRAFEFNAADYGLLNRFKQVYLAAEAKEKRLRFVRSPYTKEHPEDCGYKAVHAYLPFSLLLQKIGKGDQIDDYLQFFYEWGAPLQIMDDLNDLEEDLKNGHYSYPTLGFEEELLRQPPSDVSKVIKSDREHIKWLYQVCRGLIESARNRSADLGADLMGHFVTILESRLDSFFSEMLSPHEGNVRPQDSANY